MKFTSKIFTPNGKWHSKYSLTEKMFGISCICILIGGLLILFNNTLHINSLGLIGGILSITSGALIVLSNIISPFEYENLYGKFSGTISIDEDEIIIDNKHFILTDTTAIELKLDSYYGKQTNNRRIGPRYYQGVNNEISILINKEIVRTFFLISSEDHLEKVEKIIFNIIVKEKIKFKYRYLDYISNDLKDTSTYKQFIQKLKNEKRLLVK